MTPIVSKTREIPTTELVTGVGTDFSSDITSSLAIFDIQAFDGQYDGNYKAFGTSTINIANNVMVMTPSTTNEGFQFAKENISGPRFLFARSDTTFAS